MARIPDDLLRRIRDEVPLERLAEGRGIDLGGWTVSSSCHKMWWWTERLTTSRFRRFSRLAATIH